MTTIVIDNNTITYYYNNQPHRTDGPAFIHKNGTREWYLYGRLHREDGAAIECNEAREWHIDGQWHREDGPAIEYSDGFFHYFKNGLDHREDGPASREQCIRWVHYPQIDQHKVENYYIDKWLINGVLHREDGPAEVSPHSCDWYVYGKLHREDGPAYERKPNSIESSHFNTYWLCGVEYTLDEYLKLIKLESLDNNILK